MKDTLSNRWAWMSAATTIATASVLVTACGHQATPTMSSQAPTADNAQLASVTSAQPYTIEQTLPPPPPDASEHYHRQLSVVEYDGKPCLEDHYGHRYDACRDSSGNLYPAYYDRSTDRYLPLYYDGDRDGYYCVAQDPDDHRFCRHYIDDSDYERYYADPVNYDDYDPDEDDRPVIYTSPEFYHHHHNDDWMIALPAITIAVVLLQPHHHDGGHGWSQPSGYSRPVNQVNVVTNNYYFNGTYRPERSGPIGAPAGHPDYKRQGLQTAALHPIGTTGRQGVRPTGSWTHRPGATVATTQPPPNGREERNGQPWTGRPGARGAPGERRPTNPFMRHPVATAVAGAVAVHAIHNAVVKRQERTASREPGNQAHPATERRHTTVARVENRPSPTPKRLYMHRAEVTRPRVVRSLPAVGNQEPRPAEVNRRAANPAVSTESHRRPEDRPRPSFVEPRPQPTSLERRQQPEQQARRFSPPARQAPRTESRPQETSRPRPNPVAETRRPQQPQRRSQPSPSHDNHQGGDDHKKKDQ